MLPMVRKRRSTQAHHRFWHLCVSTEERAEVDAIHLSQEAAMALRKALGQRGDA